MRRCRIRAGCIIEQVDAAELAPGEFAQRVRTCVEEHSARTVVIDSLNGYQAAMPEEKQLILHMHELLQFLNRQGATTFLTVAQHGLVGDMQAPVDVTYLADTVILLRYFEAVGRVRRAISVIKKRTSAHEDTIREYRIGKSGITLGPPLTNFQGVLRGVPEMIGADEATDGTGGRVTSVDRSETALILAPVGRDAAIARGDAARGAHCVADLSGPRFAWCVSCSGGAGFVCCHRGGAARPRPARAVSVDPRAAGMVRLPFVLLTRRAAGSSAIPKPDACLTRSATSPSSSGRSIRPRWSAWRERRSGRAGGNMTRAPGSKNSGERGTAAQCE